MYTGRRAELVHRRRDREEAQQEEESSRDKRFTASNQWILPMRSLRVVREQQVPNSFDHAHCLFKLFSVFRRIFADVY